MKTIILFIYINLISITNSFASDNYVKIVLKVGDNLITSQDVFKEKNILKILNPQLKSLEDEQINIIAKNSLKREIIKLNEIEKFYQIDYMSNQVDLFIKQIYSSLNFESIDEFKNHLSKSKINYEDVKKKLIIEKSWNQLIFDRYRNSVKIDENNFRKQYEENLIDNKKEKSFLLYEIVFLEKDKKQFEKKYNEILSSINNIGFKQTASIFSESNSSKEKGEIGWINSSQLSELILENISNLKKNEFSKPISTAGGTLILYIDDIKEIEIQRINKETEISKMISLERDRQLNEFSMLHYKKIENSIYVKEF
jgi:peptidyl-prolyl cis-trans isomerase SurA